MTHTQAQTEKVAKVRWKDDGPIRTYYVEGNEGVTATKEAEFRKAVALAGYTHYISCGRKYKVKCAALNQASQA